MQRTWEAGHMTRSHKQAAMELSLCFLFFFIYDLAPLLEGGLGFFGGVGLEKE